MDAERNPDGPSIDPAVPDDDDVGHAGAFDAGDLPDLRSVLDQLFAFVGVMTPDGVLVHANRAPLDIAGIRADDVIGRSLDETFWFASGGDNLERLRDAIRRAAAGEVVRYDTRVGVAGGRTMDIDFQIAPLRDAEGHVVALVPSAIDIDRRVATQRRFEDAAALLAGITQGTSDLIAAEDEDYRYLFFNEAYRQEFRKLWGRDIEVGTSMLEAMADFPEEREKARAIWARALAGEAFNVVMEFGPNEAERFVYDLRFSPVRDPSGRRIGAAHIFRDVTGEFRLKAALVDSERRANQILDNIADAFLAVDRDWRITYVNPRAEAMLRPLGLTRDALLGSVVWATVGGALGQSFEEVCLQASSEQRESSAECHVAALDAWFDVRAYPSADEIYIHMLDVSERKRGDQLRDLLLEEMNHRIKNTLAVVQGIAKQTFRGAVDPAVGGVFESRISALAAANNLLTAGQWGPTPIGRLVDDVLAVAAPPGAAITVGGPAVMLGSRQAVYLAMALHELATNATKYGALSVPSGRVDLRWTLDDGGEDGDRIGLSWTERGGPKVSLPKRRGFGTRMIEQALAYEFHGEVHQDWAPEGLVCVLAGRLPAVAEG